MIDIIMQQPATADFIAGKIYRYFVREELSPELQKQLGAALAEFRPPDLAPLEKIFLSRDFYSSASVGTQIKSPVVLAVSTYRKLGLKSIPGVPDFNSATAELGQQLFSPVCCQNRIGFRFNDLRWPNRGASGGRVPAC